MYHSRGTAGTLPRVWYVIVHRKRVGRCPIASWLQSVTDGYNGTLLAYGPSSRGFGGPLRPMSRAGPLPPAGDVMPGDDDDDALPAVLQGGVSGAAKEERGLIPRALEHLFNIIGRDTAHAYDVSVSYVQIYCELVHDLLSAEPAEKNLSLREDGDGVVYVDGVSRMRVHDANHCLSLLAQGHRNRATARTRYEVHQLLRLPSHRVKLLPSRCTSVESERE